MASMAARVVLGLILACCMAVYANAQGGDCCGSFSSPSLSYSQNRNGGTPGVYGYASTNYKSACGSCTSANYNVNSLDQCKFRGTLPEITSYTCDYALSSLSEYSSKKVTSKNLPCNYNSDSSTPINDTHVEQCYTSYLGIATATFDVSSPTSKAKIFCSKLAVSSKNCYENRI